MSRAGAKGEDAMKKFIVALFIALLAAMPLAAEAQAKNKKKKKQNEENPLVLLLGIFSTANCIVGCGTVTKLTVTTVFVPQQERFVTTVTKSSSIAGAYLGGAIACTAIWPFLTAALGQQPTSEEAIMYTASCWVPGLGLILYLKQQGAI